MKTYKHPAHLPKYPPRGISQDHIKPANPIIYFQKIKMIYIFLGNIKTIQIQYGNIGESFLAMKVISFF